MQKSMLFLKVMVLVLCSQSAMAWAQGSTAPVAQIEQQSKLPQVEQEEVATHRIGPRPAVRRKTSEDGQIFRSVGLEVVVDAQGNVVSMKPVEGDRESYGAAVAEAMQWKYIPFERDGAATAASFVDYVRVLPPEDMPKIHRDFPNINSPSGVVMTLERTGCFGSCPGYQIEIHGDGTVVYTGGSFVVVTGEHHDHLTQDEVTELIEAFRAADYFSLKEEYKYPVTDCPTYTTAFQVDQVKKSITDYVGEEAGMPHGVAEIEQAIDRIADTRKWIRGTEETVPTLKKEGFDFKSTEAASMLARATQQGSTAMVKDLLAEGVGLSGKAEEGSLALVAAAKRGDRAMAELLIKAGAGKDDPGMKTEALAAAACTGDLALVKTLIAYGGDPRGETRDEHVVEYGAMTVLMCAATYGVPEIVETILAAKPAINARDERGRTALWYLTEGSPNRDEARHADRGRVAHLLARAGANLNSQDDEGNAALHTADGEEIARSLIDDGANVDIRNARGETPLMMNYSVEVAKLLVAAGADILARDHEGKTALDHALELVMGDGDRVKYLRSLKIPETPKKAEPAQKDAPARNDPN